MAKEPEDASTWIKLPEVGYGSPTVKRFGCSVGYQSKRLYLGGKRPLSVAVQTLLDLAGNLLAWDSPEDMATDIAACCELVESLEPAESN